MRGTPANGGKISDGDEEGDGKNKKKNEEREEKQGLMVDHKSRNLTWGKFSLFCVGEQKKKKKIHRKKTLF